MALGTLLNRLFGTGFAVMSDATRQQTTKGIWLSRSQQQPILVMDVEGTDGRERGEDQEFERRSALFSMAAAQIIIINIWENMVGLYNGANMGLLKTVFEVNLQLLQHKDAPKTLLLFVIRDHLGTTPLVNLQTVLEQSLGRLWSDLSKPAGLEECKMNQFFDLAFAALPHKILQADQFEQGCKVLQQRFSNPTHSDYLFREVYHRKIPADGFPLYLKSIWERIMDNKDLDIPSQQQLLAQYRCDEIASVTFQSFTQDLKPLERQIETGQVLNDFNQLALVRQASLDEFKKNAGRYHVVVFEKKLWELTEKMVALLNVLFVGQLRNLRRKCLGDFKLSIQAILAEDPDHFAERLQQAQLDSEHKFESAAKLAVLESTDWSFEEEFRSLREELQDLVTRVRAEEMDKLMKKLLKSASNHLSEVVMESMDVASRDMWTLLVENFATYSRHMVGNFGSKVAGYGIDETELEELKDSLEKQAWEVVRHRIREELADHMLQGRLKARFERKFRYDEQGLPRVWQEGQNIERYYLEARDEAEQLVSLFSKIPLSTLEPQVKCILQDEDYDEALKVIQLLPPSKQRDLCERLRKDADLVFVEVKRGAISSLSEIPRGMWLLLFAFGFNELYAAVTFLLSNPLVLVLLILVGLIGAFLYQSGLLMPVTQTLFKSFLPSLRVAVAAAGPFIETLGDSVAVFAKQVAQNLSSPTKDPSPGPRTVKGQSGSKDLGAGQSTAFSTPNFSTPLKRRTVMDDGGSVSSTSGGDTSETSPSPASRSVYSTPMKGKHVAM